MLNFFTFAKNEWVLIMEIRGDKPFVSTVKSALKICSKTERKLLWSLEFKHRQKYKFWNKTENQEKIWLNDNYFRRSSQMKSTVSLSDLVLGALAVVEWSLSNLLAEYPWFSKTSRGLFPSLLKCLICRAKRKVRRVQKKNRLKQTRLRDKNELRRKPTVSLDILSIVNISNLHFCIVYSGYFFRFRDL